LFSSTRRVAPWEVVLSLLIVLAALLLAVRTRAPGGEGRGLLRDFATLDAGAACLREGCSPYDVSALDRMVVERGHAPLQYWELELPIYPPTSIALFLPFSYFSIRNASIAMWLLILAVELVVGFAVFVRGSLLADIPPVVRALLFGVLLASGEARFALLLGNPITLAVPLLLFCCLDTAPSRRNLRAVLLTVACLLKPQIGLPFLLPLLIKPADGWRTVLRAVVCMAVFTAAVLGWCAVHPSLAGWMTDLHRELALGASAGNSMNPSARDHALDSLLNVEYLVGYWIYAPHTRLLVSTITWFVMGVGLLAGAWRAAVHPGRLRVLLVFAATAAWTLMPVYHRFYDNILLLVTLPFAVVAIHSRVHLFAAAAVVVGYLEGVLEWLHHSAKISAMEGFERPRSMGDFLLHRVDSLSAFLVCLVLIITLLAYREPANAGSTQT
jgi:hypothetical protein